MVNSASLAQTRGVIGVGYERRSVEGVIADLVAADVSLVADVRLTPLSRKAGFSKRALAAALAEAGIGYEHLPELGNPKANRAGFAGCDQSLAQARAVFGELLGGPEASRALDRLATAGDHGLVALLCFETDQRRCHRDVILEALVGGAATGVGSTPQAR